MSLAQVLSTYITLNIFVVLSYFVLKVGKFLNFSAQTELRLHYTVLFSLITLTLAHPLFPKSQFFNPPAKVWSATSIRSFPNDYTAPDKGGYLAIPTSQDKVSTVDADKVTLLLSLLSFFVLAMGLQRIWKDLNSLRTIRQKSYLVRRIKNVSIFANDEITVPFSYWTPGRADIVIPNSLFAKPLDYKMALAHEIQHHRQQDTKWVYIIWALRIVCVLNPIIHIWSRWLSEIQEFACDETLVDRRKVESHSYARCLVEVAQTAINQKYIPACATGLTFLTDRNLLNRRIEKMFSTVNTNKRKSMSWVTAVVAVALMAVTAFASQGLVQDRRVTMADAQRMAAKIQSNSDFPVVVNDLVLKQLNRYIGTPEGRDYMKKSLQRMENYRNQIEAKLRHYQVPFEILALPIIESGYQNLSEAESNSPSRAAGMWQFIPSTARNFGLRVDGQVDERLNVDLETDAAMRYLKSEHLRFRDWQLTVMSYNMGDKHVQRGLTATNSRNAWVLIRNGFENDKDYLPKMMAAILIMNNPESVQ